MQINLFNIYLQSLLFNPAKPYARGQGPNCSDIEMMIDCMVFIDNMIIY